jgi:hypothetical protein
MHRFFDSSPISPSGRYAAVFQLPFEDRQPEPGEAGNVRLVDLETGENRVVAESRGWEPQLGANINWGATDHELFFNDMDTETWRPFAWKIDPLSGKKDRMEGSVYHASPDGKWLISANLPLLRKTQTGYGVAVPKETARRNVGLVDDDGFYLTDTATGKRRLLASIRDLMTKADPPVLHEDIENCEVYGNHSKFNPQGTRLMLSLRWFVESGDDTWSVCENDWKALRFAWVTIPTNGGDIHCAAGPEQFIKKGHHATWCPDGEHISMNLKLDGNAMRFVSVKYDGTDLSEMIDDVRGSGHPTVHPGGHILTDTYLQSWDFPQYGDGTVPLRWVDIKSGYECVAVRIRTQQPCDDVALRVDPHPSWDRTWRYVTFNGYAGGTRRVFLADMQPLLSGEALPAGHALVGHGLRLRRGLRKTLRGVTARLPGKGLGLRRRMRGVLNRATRLRPGSWK